MLTANTPPAPGFRDAGGRGSDAGGTLYAVGSYGYSWGSSVPTGIYAYTLYFSPGGIAPHYNDARAYGYQLRCLQE